MAVAIKDMQVRACQHINGQFGRINALFQPFTKPPSCVTSLYAKNDQAIKGQHSLVNPICNVHFYLLLLLQTSGLFAQTEDTRVNIDNNLPRQGH